MRIAVAGGTGVAGRYVVEAAEADGHDVVVLSRGTGVDVRTGVGLAGALQGVEVVVDTLNLVTGKRSAMTDFFVGATGNLHSAGSDAGVARMVVLSIVGIDRIPGFAYYRAKLAHEEAALAGPVPVTVVRATQFQEFAGQILDRIRLGPLATVPSMRIRPVAARTLGRTLVEVASDPVVGPMREVAGPEEIGLVAMARRTVQVRGSHRVVLPVRIPGATGAAMRNGALLPGDGALIVGPGPEEWLASPDVR